VIRVVALDEIESVHQRLDHRLIRVGYGSHDRVVAVLAERFVGPVAPRDSDHRDLESAVSLEVIQRGEQLALGEVTGRTEQHQRVGGGLGSNTHLS